MDNQEFYEMIKSLPAENSVFAEVFQKEGQKTLKKEPFPQAVKTLKTTKKRENNARGEKLPDIKRKVRREGVNALSDLDFLTLLLSPYVPEEDAKALAEELLGEYGSVNAVLNAHEQDLLRFKNMTGEAAFQTAFAKSINVPILRTGLFKNGSSVSREAALEFLKKAIGSRPNEHLYLLCYDKKDRLLLCKKVAEGNVFYINIDIRLLADIALKAKAHYVLLAHNHPSGSPQPSKEDIDKTKEIEIILQGLHITLHDHVIVAGEHSYSMREYGVIGKGR